MGKVASEVPREASDSRLKAVKTTAVKGQVRTRRLGLNLPETTVEMLEGLAAKSGRTMKDIIRIALGLVKVAINERAKGNKLAILSPNNVPLTELLFIFDD